MEFLPCYVAKMAACLAVVRWLYAAQPNFVCIFPVTESAPTLTIYSDTVHNVSLQSILEGRALYEVTETPL